MTPRISLNTPKALANFSPRFEPARTLGTITLKGVLTLQGFANPGLKFASAFGVFKLNQLCLKSQKSLSDRVSTGSGSDLVSDQHAIFPNDS